MPRLDTTRFKSWMQQLIDGNLIPGLDNKVHVVAGRVTDMPDRQIALTKIGGNRTVMQGAFEEITFRVQTRGRSNSIEDAENIAQAVDTFLWAKTNFDIGDIYVTSVSYGSSPRQLPITDSQSRYNFSADYKFVASREES